MSEVVLLAGGLGTRLRSVVADRPKPLSLIAGRPFIEWQIESMSKKGVCKVILAVGYLGEMIEAHLGSKFSGCDLIYSYETSALGTGGAIRQAMDFTSASHVFVSNGDTFINANFSALESAFERHPNLAASISVIHESNADRFAFVHWDKNTDLVTAFSNKGAAQSGWINAGLYCLKVDKFKSMTTAGKFSIEQDFFEKRVDQAIIAAVALDSQFIDIGVPTDYEKAQSFIPQYSAQLR